MPKPRKQKVVNEKIDALQKFWGDFRTQCEEFESRVNTECAESCIKIRKIYEDKLKALPENIRNMTLREYMEFQRQAEQKKNKMPLIRSECKRSRLDSEKKTLQKKLKSERKRSVSVSVCSGVKAYPEVPPLSRSSRVLSESCLNTSTFTWAAVTLRFDPRKPISKACMRRPKAGEVIMSVKGSPLINFVEEASDKPGVSVSLGSGKVIKITEDTELSKLENDILKKLDEDVRSTLINFGALLNLLSIHGVDTELITQVYKQLSYFVCAVALNNLLQRKDLCHWSKGMQIRWNLHELEQCIRNLRMTHIEVIEPLQPIVQASQLLQARKTDEDVQSVSKMCDKLTTSQIIKILNLYTPADDYEERFHVSFISKMEACLHKRDEEMEISGTSSLLMDTKYAFPIRFNFVPSNIQLEDIVIPEYLDLHHVLRKV